MENKFLRMNYAWVKRCRVGYNVLTSYLFCKWQKDFIKLIVGFADC